MICFRKCQSGGTGEKTSEFHVSHFVEKNGQLVMSLGAPGGPRIITGVLQSLYRVLVNNYNMEEAIHAPRVHHQFKPDKLYVDYKRLPPLSIQSLENSGTRLKRVGELLSMV